jgi:hypothetical protein
MKATLVLPKAEKKGNNFVLGDKVSVKHIREGKIIYSDEEK